MEAMKSDVDEIALQGIEFWSTVCDEEVDLAIELSEVNLNSGFFFSPWILPISCNLSKKIIKFMVQST